MTRNGDGRMLRTFPAKPFVVERAANDVLTTTDGRTLHDFGGASHGVALIGHNHPRVVAAIQDQLGRIMHLAQGIPNPARGAFLDALHARLPAELATTFLTNSGTEAVECALKAAVSGGRRNIVALQGAFHGRTLGALSGTARPGFRDPFAHALLPTTFIAPKPDALDAVDDETAAIIVEPVQGEGGVREIDADFLRAVRDVATERGAMMVVDEVQSGLCRTGAFLALSRAGVVPDALLLAKGLAGGVPIGACSMTEAAASRFGPGTHGGTYGGAPLACAAGSAALAVLADERLDARATHLGARVRDAIAALQHPAIVGTTGRGMMIGIDLKIRSGPILEGLAARGFLCLAGGPTALRVLPPLTTPEPTMDAFVAALGDVLTEASGAPAGSA